MVGDHLFRTSVRCLRSVESFTTSSFCVWATGTRRGREWWRARSFLIVSVVCWISARSSFFARLRAKRDRSRGTVAYSSRSLARWARVRRSSFCTALRAGFGTGTMGIVGFHLVIDQHIDGVLLPCVFEEIFLSPALEHAIGHVDGGQIPAAGEGRRLMPVRAEPGDLTEAQLPLQEANRLVVE